MKPKSPMRLVMNALFAAAAGRLVEPMADEDVRADADQFPEEEHHHEVIREDDADHREHEEREAGEVAGLALVVVHVPEGINMDERADAGNDEEHRLAELIDGEADGDREIRDHVQPLVRGHLQAVGLAEEQQVARKEITQAATEINALTLRRRWVKSVMNAALRSG